MKLLGEYSSGYLNAEKQFNILYFITFSFFNLDSFSKQISEYKYLIIAEMETQIIT